MPAVILFYQVFKENAAERVCLCVYVKERACGGVIVMILLLMLCVLLYMKSAHEFVNFDGYSTLSKC